ncbi:MAG: amidohydrolase family protein [Alphaproteobacteria bacterium]
MLAPPEVAVPPQQDQVFAHVTVLNPGERPLHDYTVEVKGGNITGLRPSIEADPVGECTGCWVMPGLIDAHVHFPPAVLRGNQEIFALLYLAHGVTTIRDVGQADGSVVDLAEKLNGGTLAGPRMYRCGPVLEGDPPAWPTARVLHTAAEATQAVDELAAGGVDCLKLYNEIGPKVYEAIAVAAKRHELPLIGHVPHKVGLRNVRYFEAQHMTGLPYVTRPRPPVGDDVAFVDVLAMDGAEINGALAVAKRNNVSFTPTLANFKLRLSASDPTRFPPPTALATLPAFWQQGFRLVAGFPKTETGIAQQQAMYPALVAQVRQAREMNIPILAGTDTLMPYVIPGDALHRELAALQEPLGSAEAALTAATLVNGRAIDDGNIGRIAVGARADLLLLSADPRDDLSVLKAWRTVIVDGRVYDPAFIASTLSTYQTYFDGWLYRALTSALVGLLASSYQSAEAAKSDN